MSLSKFNGKVVLSATNLADVSTPAGAQTKWNATFSFSDLSGKYSGTGIAVGDVIALDTSGVDIATVTTYSVSSVVSSTPGSFRVVMDYMTSNANPNGAPDIAAAIDIPGYVGRKTTVKGLHVLPSLGTQLLSDAFTTILSNNNADSLDPLGTAASISGGTAGTIVYQSGANTTAFSTAGTTGQLLASGGTAAPFWVSAANLTVSASAVTTNVTGGAAGAVLYQTGTSATGFSAVGTSGQVLVSGGAGAPTWVNQSTLTTTASSTTNLSGGVAGGVPYQSATGTTSYLGAGTSGQILTSGGTGAPTWTSPASLSVSSATTATNLAGGVAGAIHYQSAVGTTGFSAAGTAGQVLVSGGTGAPTWSNASSLTVSSASTATTATNVAGGVAGAVHYQSAAGVTGFSAAGTSGQVLVSGGTGAPTWSNASALSVSSATTATNLAGGVAGAIHYQSAAGTTAFTAAGTSGQILTSAGAGTPTWTSASSLTVSSATTATNLAGGVAGAIHYQSAAGTTGFSAAGTSGQVLVSGGTGAPTWSNASSITVGTATSATTATTSTNLSGAQWAIPYQSALNTTSMLAAGTAGQVLTSNGAAAPSWSALSATTQAYGDNTTNIATTAFVDRLRSSPTSTNTTAAVADRGKTILATAGVTFPASVFAAGDCVSVYNNSAANITLTSGAGLTLYLVGTATTGNRTLAQRGIATVYYVSATEAVITGGGLT